MEQVLYGKNPFQNIVSIEPSDNHTEIFYLDDGEIKSEFVSNKYWCLTDKPINKNCVRMLGNQHYKYGIQFSESEAYNDFVKKNFRRADIYHIYDTKEMFMVKDGYTYFKGLEPKDVSVLSFDIESYGLLNESHHEVYIIANTFRDTRGNVIRKMFSVDEYDSEAEMLLDWVSWVRRVNPTIMTGHNIFGYDLPYLQICADNNCISLNLGRNGSPITFNERTSSYRVDGSQTWEYRNCKIYGREIIDTAFLSVKYDIGRNFPSWGLKPIIKYLGFEDPNRQHYDASKIRHNWKNPEERRKIKAYAEGDGDDALKLFDLMIPPYFYMCQSIPKSFQQMINGASGSWINSILVRSYLQNRHSIPKANVKDVDVGGGMSYGIPGVYRNVTKWDAKSYYPSTMLKFNIYPDKKDPQKNFLTLLKHFTENRFKQKQLYEETGIKMYDDLQAASKIFINSSYGALATSGLNFNDFEAAAKITRCCRAGLQKAIIWATGKTVHDWWDEYKNIKTSDDDFGDFDYIDRMCENTLDDLPINNWTLCNIDTDSFSVCKKDMSEFTEDELNDIKDNLNRLMYCEWADDGYYDKVVIFKAKNYCLRKKGSTKIKIKGSSLTDSKKEPALRELINRIIADLFDDKLDIKAVYTEYIEEINSRVDFDVARWCTKKTITKKLMENERTNERVVRDAFNGRSFSEGEKVFLYYSGDKDTKSPKLREDYKNDINKTHYFKRIYDTLKILEGVISLDNIPKVYTQKVFNQYQQTGVL